MDRFIKKSMKKSSGILYFLLLVVTFGAVNALVRHPGDDNDHTTLRGLNIAHADTPYSQGGYYSQGSFGGDGGGSGDASESSSSSGCAEGNGDSSGESSTL